MRMAKADRQLTSLLFRLLLLQFAVASGLGLAAGWWHGADAMRAALFGGMAALAGTLVLLWFAWRARGAGSSPARNAALLYGGAAVRFATVLMLLAAGLAVLQLRPLWLLGGFGAGLLAQLFLTILCPETTRWRAKS